MEVICGLEEAYLDPLEVPSAIWRPIVGLLKARGGILEACVEWPFRGIGIGGILEGFVWIMRANCRLVEACLRLVEAYWRLAEGIAGLWMPIGVLCRPIGGLRRPTEGLWRPEAYGGLL